MDSFKHSPPTRSQRRIIPFGSVTHRQCCFDNCCLFPSSCIQRLDFGQLSIHGRDGPPLLSIISRTTAKVRLSTRTCCNKSLPHTCHLVRPGHFHKMPSQGPAALAEGRDCEALPASPVLDSRCRVESHGSHSQSLRLLCRQLAATRL